MKITTVWIQSGLVPFLWLGYLPQQPGGQHRTLTGGCMMLQDLLYRGELVIITLWQDCATAAQQDDLTIVCMYGSQENSRRNAHIS